MAVVIKQATVYCRRHPRYSGQRRPQTPCTSCFLVWDTVRAVMKLSTDYIVSYRPKFSSKKGA